MQLRHRGRPPKTNKPQLDSVLDECLREIETRHATAEECLTQYPEWADELAPLLDMAGSLRLSPRPDPSPEFVQATRARLLRLAPLSTNRKYTAPPNYFVAQPARVRIPGFTLPRLQLFPRTLAGVAAAILVILLIGGGTVLASAESLPSQPLYPVKRLVESAQLALANSPEARVQLLIRFADRRLSEAVAEANRGDNEWARRLIQEYQTTIEDAVDVIEQSRGTPSLPQSLYTNLENALTEQQDRLRSAPNLPPDVATPAISTTQDARDKLTTLEPAPEHNEQFPRRTPVTPSQPGSRHPTGGTGGSDAKPAASPPTGVPTTVTPTLVPPDDARTEADFTPPKMIRTLVPTSPPPSAQPVTATPIPPTLVPAEPSATGPATGNTATPTSQYNTERAPTPTNTKKADAEVPKWTSTPAQQPTTPTPSSEASLVPAATQTSAPEQTPTQPATPATTAESPGGGPETRVPEPTLPATRAPTPTQNARLQ